MMRAQRAYIRVLTSAGITLDLGLEMGNGRWRFRTRPWCPRDRLDPNVTTQVELKDSTKIERWPDSKNLEPLMLLVD
jgi:hypothetical protein